MRFARAVTLAIALAGCDGGGGAGLIPTLRPVTGPDMGGLPDRSTTAMATTLTSAGAVLSGLVTAEFAADGTVQVTKSDGTRTPVMQYDAISHLYYDASKSYILAILSDPTNPDVAVLAFGDYAQDPAWTEQMFISGTRTSLAQVPTSGSASYSGLLNIETVNSATVGNIDLQVNFAAATVEGGISFETEAGSASFAVKPTPLVAGGFNAVLTDGAAAEKGIIDGSFYDPTAGQLAGTLQVDTGAGNATGAYIANR